MVEVRGIAGVVHGPEGALPVSQADDRGRREAVGAGMFQACYRNGAGKAEALWAALGSDPGGNARFFGHAAAVLSEGEDVPIAGGRGVEFPVIGVLERPPEEFEASVLPEMCAPRRVWRGGGKVGGLVEAAELVLDSQGIKGDGKLAGKRRGRLFRPVEGDQSEDGLTHGLVPRVRVWVARLSHGGTE